MNKAMLWALLLFSIKGFCQSQDMKQLELDIQKLAELKSMLSEMTRGYSVLDKGLASVTALSQGNYNLHKTFLDKQLQISVPVKNNPKIQRALNLQSIISSECTSMEQLVSQSAVLTNEERKTISGLLQNSKNRSNSLFDELTSVLTPGALRMNDAERLAAIDRIETALNDKLLLLQGQKKNLESLVNWRNKLLRENLQLKSLY